MTEHTKAQRLADILQYKIPSMECLEEAAAELRRLDALNAELVETLKRLVKRDEADGVAYTGDHPIAQAISALVKAKEQS